MLVWVGAAALIGAIGAILGIPSLSPFALTGQSYALLIAAGALIFLFGIFDTIETESIAEREKIDKR